MLIDVLETKENGAHSVRSCECNGTLFHAVAMVRPRGGTFGVTQVRSQVFGKLGGQGRLPGLRHVRARSTPRRLRTPTKKPKGLRRPLTVLPASALTTPLTPAFLDCPTHTENTSFCCSVDAFPGQSATPPPPRKRPERPSPPPNPLL